MRLANVDGRAVLLTAEDRGIDVATASGGKFGPALPVIYDDWEGFRTWAESAPSGVPETTFTRAQLCSPSPLPRQIFGIGLNYGDHAAESGFDAPKTLPPVFTKFASSLTGPDTEVELPVDGNNDWEVELVVVIGRMARRVAADDGWDHVAGLAVGQDLSERITQMIGAAPQFSLGKSLPGFSPVGPWLITPDDVPDRDDLALGCAVDGETMQDGHTRDLIFPVPALVASLSELVTLLPGDLIFTGTPSGVGLGRQPQRFLQPGERLDSWIDGIGELHQTFVSAD